MKTVQDMLKECDIKDGLILLVAGLPKKHFSKMLECYYSIYCMAVEVWCDDDTKDYVMTDFTQVGISDGKEMYCFYGRTTEMPEKSFDEKIDWNQVLLGKTRVYVPDCVDEKIDDVVLCSMVLHQMYEHCTILVPKSSNKKLFEYIKECPRERKSKISAYENLLERTIHYMTDKHYIDNAIMEYKESKCTSLKWGELLNDLEIGFTDYITSSDAGSELLEQALRNGKLPGVYRWFYNLDNENHPDLCRLYRRLKRMQSDYEDIELLDYIEVTNERKRIIVEGNGSCKKFPLIYIRDGMGNQIELGEVDLSELLCMSIRVLDTSIVEPECVLALLAFYLEYPIRVERIQRKNLIQSLIGIQSSKLILQY